MEISKIFRGDLRHVGWMHRIRAPLPCFSVEALQILRMLCQIPPWQSWWLNCHVGLGFLQLLLLSRSLWSTGKTHRKCAARCTWYIYIYMYMIENCHCCIWLWNISKHRGTLCSSVKLEGLHWSLHDWHRLHGHEHIYTVDPKFCQCPAWIWSHSCRSSLLFRHPRWVPPHNLCPNVNSNSVSRTGEMFAATRHFAVPKARSALPWSQWVFFYSEVDASCTGKGY